MTRDDAPRAARIFLLAVATLACAAAPPMDVDVDIVSEDAVIVWDAETKTEHFIRRGSFRGDDIAKLGDAGFGFLVPTPTKPILAEASDAIFDDLEAAIRPKRVTERRYTVLWSLVWTMYAMTLAGAVDRGIPKSVAPASVQVLGEQRVAGLDAVILQATDSEALAKWLSEHGYAFRDALGTWLQRYVADGWVITAFKLAPDAKANGVDTAALRMTFKTDRPFYPYREPEDQRRPRAAPRTLRVFFVGGERVTGSVGDAPWRSDLLHATPYAGALPDGTSLASDTPWLHAFIDRQSPRPGTAELWFDRDETQSERRLPPIISYHETPIPLFLDVVLGGGLFVWWRRRKKRASSPG